jgi:hypothetical protein
LKDSPFSALAVLAFAPRIIDGMVDSIVTPAGLSKLTTEAQHARYTYDSSSKFSVWLKSEKDEEIHIVLTRRVLTWKVTNIILPTTGASWIQSNSNALADPKSKDSTKSNTQNVDRLNEESKNLIVAAKPPKPPLGTSGITELAAFSEIESAFGKKLGDLFNPPETKTSDIPNHLYASLKFEFNPTKSFRSFTKYYVRITPKTKRIFCIGGIGSVANLEDGYREQALMTNILKAKYGTSDTDERMQLMHDVNRIEKGNRYVVTEFDGIFNVTIEIRYCDREIEAIAEKERLEIEKDLLDTEAKKNRQRRTLRVILSKPILPILFNY